MTLHICSHQNISMAISRSAARESFDGTDLLMYPLGPCFIFRRAITSSCSDDPVSPDGCHPDRVPSRDLQDYPIVTGTRHDT